MITKDFNDIQHKINIVTEDILKRFPECSYTIDIKLWDDGTDKVQCRHGNIKTKKLCISTYYNYQLTYEEIDMPIGAMYVDEKGYEYFRKK